jgi:hypothetical protein
MLQDQITIVYKWRAFIAIIPIATEKMKFRDTARLHHYLLPNPLAQIATELLAVFSYVARPPRLT